MCRYEKMKPAGIILYILSWGPIIWTFLILIAARFCYAGGYKLFYPMRDLFLIGLAFYILIGFWIWLLLLLFLMWKKKLTQKQCIVTISLTVFGILAAYLSLHYDVFGVSGSYID